MRHLALAAVALIGAIGAAGLARAEPPWIEAASRTAAETAALPPDAATEDRAAAVEHAVLAARAALLASLTGDAAASEPAVAPDQPLSIPTTFLAAYSIPPAAVAAGPGAQAHGPNPAIATLLAARSAGDAAAPAPLVAAGAAPPVDLVTLPLPPEKPWPGLEPVPSTLLPYTGARLRAMPELPPLQPRGRLASFDDGRPYGHFNASLDCITDHQRFDRQSGRQKFPHACGPTRDIDVALPGFTTR